MIKNLKKGFEWLKGIQPGSSGPVGFILQLNELEVGRLLYSDGLWHFRYSEEFQKQDEFREITDFPAKDRVYTSKDLWPFFALRIPSLAQPRVKEWAQAQESEEAANEASMLKYFGRVTAANPFVLNPLQETFS
ncbi:HipA N-terminal domain-containing protein [Roseibacillus persicicus]|uniref:HipA N-terminal domain-containing protein n=1 Tax=Roseibacillus persicicus TaxID=454148 RepID=UPI00280DAD3B|nr:HipA N-terminal domain-containing protein [Roseibacillus persicicus]MDQ8191293.1 HipA N-terminal domain-containing protein [Roseibacillus persicicus]